MHELIITHVIPAVLEDPELFGSMEPAKTFVYRFQLESETDVESVLDMAGTLGVRGGMMTNLLPKIVHAEDVIESGEDDRGLTNEEREAIYALQLRAIADLEKEADDDES
jgi:hypothetical protein